MSSDESPANNLPEALRPRRVFNRAAMLQRLAAVDAAVSHERLVEFLDALASCGVVGRASEHAGLHRRALYRLRERDPDFAAAWQEALELGIIALEEEMLRRGFQGWEEPRFHDGQLIQREVLDPDTGERRLEPIGIKKFSDTAAIFMLKSLRPEKYRERFDLNHGGAVDMAPGAPQLDLTRLTLDELREFKRLTEKATVPDAIDVTPQE